MFPLQPQRPQQPANFLFSAFDNYLNTLQQPGSSSNQQSNNQQPSNQQSSNSDIDPLGLDLFSQSMFPSDGLSIQQHRDIAPAQQQLHAPAQQPQSQQRGALGQRTEQGGTRGRDQVAASRMMVVGPENVISETQHAALQSRIERLELAVGRMELVLGHIRMDTKTSVENMGAKNEEISNWIEKIKNGMEKFFKHYEKQFDDAVDMTGQWEPETSF